MAYVEQVADAEVNAVFGPYALQLKLSGVTAFQHTEELTVKRLGMNNFGGTGPVAITDDYQGESGQITLEGVDGDKALIALMNGNPPATHVVDNPKNRYPLYLVSNAFDEDKTTPLRSDFVSYAKFENTPRPVGPDARSYNFQAKWAKVFHGKKIAIQVFDGNATPVTALTLTSPAYQDPDDQMIALAVLRQTANTRTVKPLAKTTDYTETTSVITLGTGLAATEKAAVIYVVA